MSEQEGNPYNAKKPWHTPDKPTMDNADGLFFEPEATSEEAPQEEPSHDYKKRYDDLKNIMIIRFLNLNKRNRN